MAKQTDKTTLVLIAEVKKRKDEIAKLERPNWKTNCSFSYTEGKLDNPINIHVETKLPVLISIVGFLQARRKAYASAADTLEVESPPDFKWSGFSLADWTEDIKTRINKIQIASKREKLKKLEERLDKIISPELRTKMELEAIQAELEEE
jgi:hypothetical protein